MDKFQALAEQISRDAAAVECSPEQYREGLALIIDMLEADKRANEETSK